MHDLTRLIKADMKPALGVTEPGAIASAVAKAREQVDGEIERVSVSLNSGMYKNGYTCGIPNSDAVGNVFAAALGAVAAEPELGLQSLMNVTAEDNEEAQALIQAGKVYVLLDHMGSDITIDVTVQTVEETCTVSIADSHTQVYRIEKNGKVIFEQPRQQAGSKKEIDIHSYTLHDLLEYVRTVPLTEISFIRDAFTTNMDLLEEGLDSPKTTFSRRLFKENGSHLISEDALKTAQLLCNGAIEARVLGLNKPAMSITGSGAHGIIAAMPLFAYFEVNFAVVDDDLLIRATALSYLITTYIKEYSGKLSAFCGCGIAAGTGMACGLGYMRGGGEEELTRIIQNMASGITGMICDGGNQGCVMKGIVAVDAAFRSVDLAMHGIGIESQHGINGRTPEDTMKHMGMIASPGMIETEKTIVQIMQNK